MGMRENAAGWAGHVLSHVTGAEQFYSRPLLPLPHILRLYTCIDFIVIFGCEATFIGFFVRPSTRMSGRTFGLL